MRHLRQLVSAQRRLGFRLGAPEAFLPVWFAIQKSEGAPFLQTTFLQHLQDARSRFQLYGKEDEIALMENFIAAVQNSNLAGASTALNQLVPLVRDRIHLELRIES